LITFAARKRARVDKLKRLKKSLKNFSQTLVRKKNLITFATPKQRENKRKNNGSFKNKK
jgi:hypothetical protein